MTSRRQPNSASDEPGTETAEVSPTAIARAAAAAIEGHAAGDGHTVQGQGAAVDQYGNTGLSTIDSFYQYHTGLDDNADVDLDAPPPAYSDEWGHIQDTQSGMGTNAQVAGMEE